MVQVVSNSPDQHRELRVFVASPGDVSDAREAVSKVIEILNAELEREQRPVRFQPVRWENYPHPRDARLTPQAAIASDKGIPLPSDCDVAVFIFWRRIGTVLDMNNLPPNGAGERATGTTWEYYNALESGKPQLLVYRNTAPPPEHDLVDESDQQYEARTSQERGLRQFFRALRGPNGEYLSYTQDYDLLDVFKTDLREQLRLFANNGRDGKAEADAPVGSAFDPMPVTYFRYLTRQYQHIDLSALGSSSDELLPLQLPQVYVPALTTARAKERQRVDEQEVVFEHDRPSHETLLERLGEESLYVSGNAGQGKSTFCQWLMLSVAHGSVPSTSDADEQSTDGDDIYREQLPDSLAGRLPLLLRLSEFWRSLALQPQQTAIGHTQFEQALCRWLDEHRPGGLSAAHWHYHIKQRSLLLVLDGVDEVPEKEHDCYPRQALLNALANVLDTWHAQGVRVLLTSRPYGLSRSQSARLGLSEAPLTLLPQNLQQRFVRRWFDAVNASARVDKLLDELQGREDLRELRENPLLLTAVCVKYHNQKELPQDIHDLYQSIVAQVLYSRFPERGEREQIERRLEVIALGMHCGDKNNCRDVPARDISCREIDNYLIAYAALSEVQEGDADRATERREHLLSHSGLLVNRADQRAGFSHWTFQDYFTAQRLYRQEIPLEQLLNEHAAEPQWQNTLRMLLARRIDERDLDRALDDLNVLRPRLEPAQLREQPQPALLLGKLLEIVYFRTKGRQMRDWAAVFKRICTDALAHVDDPAVRNRLFTDLARIGADDRPGVGLNDDGLPDISWVEVPAGTFLFGEEKKKQQLANFLISRYPITHAQFQAFIDADGFNPQQPWWDGLQCTPPTSASWSFPNRPRERVSWYDATAFCRWLSQRTGHEIALPTETQWEKAARGENGWIYPWGDEYHSGAANCNEKIDKDEPFYLEETSAVGIYPENRSPYDAVDMIGNVWEWTDSFYDKDKDFYAICGISWFDFSSLARAVSRGLYIPGDRGFNVGFRVVCVPHRRP